MDKIVFALLRGVCQLPAYVAHAKGFLRDVDIDAELSIAPTAWTVPQRLVDGEVHFAVIPWTRVAADNSTQQADADQRLGLRRSCNGRAQRHDRRAGDRRRGAQ